MHRREGGGAEGTYSTYPSPGRARAQARWSARSRGTRSRDSPRTKRGATCSQGPARRREGARRASSSAEHRATPSTAQAKRKKGGLALSLNGAPKPKGRGCVGGGPGDAPQGNSGLLVPAVLPHLLLLWALQTSVSSPYNTKC